MQGAMMADYTTTTEKAEKLKALAHPVRLCIVRGLLQSGSCNVTCMQSNLNLPQSTISQHLAKLRAARIIEGVRNGLEVYYKVVDHDAINLITTLFGA
jgi:ArsR family transcriptional regulator